jgi:uncharacterized OB-fold protein
MQEAQQQQQSKSKDAAVYLTRCASCGGQFPTFRAICSECEDAAEVDGFRNGKKMAPSDTSLATPAVAR